MPIVTKPSAPIAGPLSSEAHADRTVIELALARAALEKSALALSHLAAMDQLFKRRLGFWLAAGEGGRALHNALTILTRSQS